MKVNPLSILIVSLVAVFLFTGWTENQPASQETRLISVSGDADVRVIPDEVILTLGVETWDKDLEQTKRQNDQRVRQVLALAQTYGIEAQHIQTDHISVEPRYGDDYEKRNFIGFFVRKTIVITLKDISKFEDLLTDALGAGVNYVHGIQFRTTELRKHRDEARALAIKAAREKAIALANELGQDVGEPHRIYEERGTWWSSYGSWWRSRWGSAMAQNVIQEAGGSTVTAEGSMAPGQITVNAKVTVSFELK